MSLPPAQIEANYRACCSLAKQVIRHKLAARGHHIAADHPQARELLDSVTGHPPLVMLIQTTPFAADIYLPEIMAALATVRRLLFPDTRKRRFLSLDAPGARALSVDPPEVKESGEAPAAARRENGLAGMIDRLPPAQRDYLETVLLPRFPRMGEWMGLQAAAQARTGIADAKVITHRLRLLQRFCPQGTIDFSCPADGNQPLADEMIEKIYLHVYLGIDTGFPRHFLAHDGARRAAVLVRFLIEKILRISAEELLSAGDPLFFDRHHLQNVYHLFNYSVNRVLRNAYPDLIPPWLNSRCRPNYWEARSHRIGAVRWLVEQRMGCPPESLYSRRISKNDFAKNGLSYMFNRYYNAVSRALAEAYPQLRPWEIGKVPGHFWTDRTAAQAIRWAIEKKGWRPAELPVRVADGTLNRKTFSEFGLATLFERRYARSIYRAVDAAFPGCFFRWQFGKVPDRYWQRPAHVYAAARWIAGQEGLPAGEIVSAVRQGRLTWRTMGKYPVGAALERACGGRLEAAFEPQFREACRQELARRRLKRQLMSVREGVLQPGLLVNLLDGLFAQPAAASGGVSRLARVARRMR